jgi:hypothetical protein
MEQREVLAWLYETKKKKMHGTRAMRWRGSVNRIFIRDTFLPRRQDALEEIIVMSVSCESRHHGRKQPA